MIYASATQIHKQSFLVHLISGLYCIFCLITGIACAFTLQWAILCGYICSIPLAYLFELNKSTIFCGMLFFATGYARFHMIKQQHENIISHVNDHTIIKGQITHVQDASHKQYRSTIFITINAYYLQGAWKPCNQPWQLQCYTKQQFTGLVNDSIVIKNFKYKVPDKNSFFYFLMKEGVHATLFLHKNNYEIITHQHRSLQRIIHELRHRILAGITQKCSQLTTTLVASIFLGNRLCVKEQYQHIKQLFANWGILHFLARSGIHMVMFIFFLQYFLRLIPAPFLLKQLLLITLSAIYTILSWHSVSFSRALLTFVWYKLCQLGTVQTSTAHIIILLSCIFLIYNPLLLFFLDFQLSFGITLTLAITNHYLFT